MIDVKNLRKSYQTQDKTVEILKGINIHVNPGDFMIIMGESGSGKTTFLNCVSGFDTIDEGSIEIGGTKLNEIKGKALEPVSYTHLDVYKRQVNKLDAYFGYCFGLVHEIIKQDEELSFIHIGVYFKKNLILLVCEDEKALQRFQHRLELIPNTSYSLEHVLAILLESVLAPMHPLFESIENTIMQMEEDILSMQKVTMTANIMKIRREITMRCV